MRCPKCKISDLECEKVFLKYIAIDQCSRCKGMWLENAELSAFLGGQPSKKITIPSYATKVPNSKCSSCNDFLYEFCYPGTLVLIDGCKQCDGVWLDDKEWNSINHARDERNKITCPKCQVRQKPSDHCSHCGIVISKYQSNVEQQHSLRDSEVVARDTLDIIINQGNTCSSYADNIPGIKGWALRTNDKIIKWLSNDLF